MKRPLRKDEPEVQEFIKSAKQHADSKSIFGLLLLLERQIRSETKHSDAATFDHKNVVKRQASTLSRTYTE
jgi:hypothetical protein